MHCTALRWSTWLCADPLGGPAAGCSTPCRRLCPPLLLLTLLLLPARLPACPPAHVPAWLACSTRKTANTYASSSVCERAEMACEEGLDREARQHLPSSGRFKVGAAAGAACPRWGTPLLPGHPAPAAAAATRVEQRVTAAAGVHEGGFPLPGPAPAAVLDNSMPHCCLPACLVGVCSRTTKLAAENSARRVWGQPWSITKVGCERGVWAGSPASCLPPQAVSTARCCWACVPLSLAAMPGRVPSSLAVARPCCIRSTSCPLALPLSLPAERLTKAWARESARFERDYNDKLLNGLVMMRWVGG